MACNCESCFWIGLFVTSVSNVKGFVDEKVFWSVSAVTVTISTPFILSALQSFYVYKLSFCWSHLATRILNVQIFYVFGFYNFIQTRQVIVQSDIVFIWTSQFYYFGCQNLVRIMPIHCPQWQEFTRTCHPCWLKTSLSNWLCFQSETRTVECRGVAPRTPTALTTNPSS